MSINPEGNEGFIQWVERVEQILGFCVDKDWLTLIAYQEGQTPTDHASRIHSEQTVLDRY